jgi:hypothetical protein
MKTMIRLGLIAAIAFATHATTAGTGAHPSTPTVTKTHQFRCTDRNTSLYFLVYEIDGTLDRGLFYVENYQSGNMTVEWAGTNFIKAKMNGNAANVAFLLGRDGNIMVANYTTSTRVAVCHASYIYR